MSKMISSQRRRRLRIIANADEHSFNLIDGGDSRAFVVPGKEIVPAELAATYHDFFADCQGRSETTLKLDRPGAAPIFVKMDRPQLMIGSDPACDVPLTDVAIRHHHCLLQWLDGHIFCCAVARRPSQADGHSRQVGGCWIDQNGISIGPYHLSIADPVSAPVPDYSALDRLPELSTEYPRLGFQFESVDREDNVWTVDRPITLVGRSSQCRLRLNHKSVQLVHACLVRTATACWMVNLANDGVTLVNDRTIRVSRIDVGDTIRIGSFQIEVTAMKSPAVKRPTPTTKPTEHRETPIAELPSELPKIELPRSRRKEAAEDQKVDVAAQGTAPIAGGDNLDISSVATVGPNQNSPFKAASIRIQPGMFTSTECDSVIIQPPLIEPSKATSSITSMPLESETKRCDSSMDEFTTLQRAQLEALRNHLNALKATFDQVAPTMISNRTREALEKPVNETIECCNAMRQLLDRFTSPQGVS